MSGYLRKMKRQQLRANQGTMDRIVRKHEDVLRSIETVFVRAYRQLKEVDDQTCHAAIESALTGQAARDPISAMLADRLGQVHQWHREVQEADRQDALRVVARSIRNHSARRPGEIEYLAFIDLYIP